MPGLSLLHFLDPGLWSQGAAPLPLLLFLLCVVGVPAAGLHGIAAWLVFRTTGHRPGRVLLVLALAVAALIAVSSLALAVGGCQSLAALGIDNLESQFRCTRLPDGLAGFLYALGATAAMLSFGWPWLLGWWLLWRTRPAAGR